MCVFLSSIMCSFFPHIKLDFDVIRWSGRVVMMALHWDLRTVLFCSIIIQHWSTFPTVVNVVLVWSWSLLPLPPTPLLHSCFDCLFNMKMRLLFFCWSVPWWVWIPFTIHQIRIQMRKNRGHKTQEKSNKLIPNSTSSLTVCVSLTMELI